MGFSYAQQPVGIHARVGEWKPLTEVEKNALVTRGVLKPSY